MIQEVYLELYRILKRRGPDYVKHRTALMQKHIRQKLARYYRSMGGRREVYEVTQKDGSTIEQADIDALSVEEIAVDHAVLEWTDRHRARHGCG